MKRYLEISPEVQDDLLNNKPIVALESTIIRMGCVSENVEMAKLVEQIVRSYGATPATIAIIGQQDKSRLNRKIQIELIGKEKRLLKPQDGIYLMC